MSVTDDCPKEIREEFYHQRADEGGEKRAKASLE